MYRFLLTPRWLGYAALTVVLAAIMVGLGFWQLHRYETRSAVNDRVEATGRAAPRPLDQVLTAPPRGAGAVGPAPSATTAWSRVSVTGRYDANREILVRGRTVGGRVGFEVVTPLVLDDGSAILVDRGWIASAPGGATVAPEVPPPPAGQVHVVGRVRAPESRADAVRERTGRLQARRISPRSAAAVLPYPLFGAYLTLQSQDPAADPRLVTVPPPHENAWQNAGYAVQWWLFAVIMVIGFGYVARREARGGFGCPGDRIGNDRLDNDRLGRDRLDNDRLGSDRLDNDRLGSDRLGRDRLDNDRSGNGSDPAAADVGRTGSDVIPD